jgi:hypothetical protein
MTIRLEYIERDQKGRIIGNPELPESTWVRITSLAARVQPDALITGRVIELEWAALLSMVVRLSDLSRQFGFRFDYSEPAREQLVRFRQEYKALRAPLPTLDISEESVQDRLNVFGFGRI